MKYFSLLSIALCLVACLNAVQSFATFMTQEHCDRKLEVGVMIMSIKAEESDKRLIVVKRGEELIEHNSVVTSLEGLTVELSPTTSQAVLEVGSSVAMFKDGRCDGQRILKTGELQVRGASMGGRHEIHIKAGWSISYEVLLTPTFTLIYDPDSSHGSSDL